MRPSEREPESRTLPPIWLSVVVAVFFGGLVALRMDPGVLEPALDGGNDFLAFYAGAKLGGTPDLYNPEKAREIQLGSAGMVAKGLSFVRLPYFALFLKPLGMLPYKTAYLVWQIANVAALVGFLALWKATPPKLTVALACCLAPALVSCLINGQDVFFLLLWIGLAARLLALNRPVAAGLVLSLCLQKYHLFALAPLWIVGQRRWRAGVGVCAGAAGLLALSFVGAGWSWPVEYLRVLSAPAIHPGVEVMPNIHGLASMDGFPFGFEVLLVALVAAAVWYVCRHGSEDYAMCATLAGGLLVSWHAYPADASLLIPAAAILLHKSSCRPTRILTFICVFPMTHVLFKRGVFPFDHVLHLSMLGMIAAMLIEVRRFRNPPTR